VTKPQTVLLSSIILLAAAALGLWTSIAFHRLHKASRTFHYPTQFIAKLKNDPQAGKKIYHEYCAACHAPHPLVDVNAPRLGNRKDWRRYRQLNTATLLAMLNRGVAAMPARGGCFECDDALLKQAIIYMLSRIR